jgi:hypothetical protein
MYKLYFTRRLASDSRQPPVHNGYRDWLLRRIITADTNQISTIGTILVNLPSDPLNPAYAVCPSEATFVSRLSQTIAQSLFALTSLPALTAEQKIKRIFIGTNAAG